VEAPPRRGVTTGRDLSQRSKWVAGRPVLEVTGRGLCPVGYRGARPDARQRCAEGASDSRLAATRHLVGTAQDLPSPRIGTRCGRRRSHILSRVRRFSDPAGVTVARIWANYCFYDTAWDAHLADEISRRAGTLLENLAL
jgi:hypothetical protein